MYTTRSHEPSIDINAPNPAPEPPAAGLRLMHTNRWLHLPDLIEPDRSLTLGRTRQRDLRIDESTVSREHCKIVRTWSNEYILHDCGSKNGLWVSRYGSYSGYERVISIKLTVGMHIRLGKATLIVVDADGAAPIIARRYSEFVMQAYAIYGNAQEVARRIGRRSQSVILRLINSLRSQVAS